MKKSIKPSMIKKAVLISMIGAFFSVAQASTVVPPPLPTGSQMVRQSAGMNQDEVKRSQRAHHHHSHHKKDVTKDDTMSGSASSYWVAEPPKAK